MALVSNLAPDSAERSDQLRRALVELAAFGDLGALKPVRAMVERAQ